MTQRARAKTAEHPTPDRPEAYRALPRPPRGNPKDTRERLVAAAAVVFNRDGYHGTDSNRLARAAGYAPATFYKHFDDKRGIFLAAYERWVDAEWTGIEREIRRAQTADARARRIVDATLRHHKRWRGLRASLRMLVAHDPTARAFYRKQRRRQLETLARLGVGTRRGDAPRAHHAVLLYALERVADAVADGELTDLDVALEPVLAILRELILEHAT